MPANPNGEPSWKWRRIVVFITIAFCFSMLAVLIDALDSSLNGTIASGLLWLVGAVILGYVGFATSQDVTAMVVSRSGRPYAADSVPTPPDPVADTVIVTPPATSVTVQQSPADPPANSAG